MSVFSLNEVHSNCIKFSNVLIKSSGNIIEVEYTVISIFYLFKEGWIFTCCYKENYEAGLYIDYIHDMLCDTLLSFAYLKVYHLYNKLIYLKF